MPRKRNSIHLRTSPPKEATWVVAVLLWLAGFASTFLGAFSLPNDLGIWLLAGSGLLLILAVIVDGL